MVTNATASYPGFGSDTFSNVDYTTPASGSETFASFGGSISVGDYGQQLYTGSEANPVFAPGVYSLDRGTLTVTVVPETSTWAMMLAGFAGLGFLGYRRHKATTFAA